MPRWLSFCASLASSARIIITLTWLWCRRDSKDPPRRHSHRDPEIGSPFRNSRSIEMWNWQTIPMRNPNRPERWHIPNNPSNPLGSLKILKNPWDVVRKTSENLWESLVHLKESWVDPSPPKQSQKKILQILKDPLKSSKSLGIVDQTLENLWASPNHV